MEMTALGKHYMADPLGLVIAAQGPLRRPVPGQGLYLHALGVTLADEVIGDEHYPVRVPDIDTELLELRGQAPWAAGVVHHGEVDMAGDDLARTNVLSPGGPGKDLFCERHGHGGGRVVLTAKHYNRIAFKLSRPCHAAGDRGAALSPAADLASSLR
jgi:hypothetical protein